MINTIDILSSTLFMQNTCLTIRYHVPNNLSTRLQSHQFCLSHTHTLTNTFPSSWSRDCLLIGDQCQTVLSEQAQNQTQQRHCFNTVWSTLEHMYGIFCLLFDGLLVTITKLHMCRLKYFHLHQMVCI